MYPIYQQSFSVPYSFPIIFTRNAFSPANGAVAECIRTETGNGKRRVIVVIDSGMAAANSEVAACIEAYAVTYREIIDLVRPPVIVCGGEACKNGFDEVRKLHFLIKETGLCRHSCIVAVGGGALLDAVGFAAASAHRGIRLLRMPTTTLSQNDAGVGVKNGVNAYGRKNFVGAFAPPCGVIADFSFLDTLPARDRRSGIAEAVKVALIRDRSFFDRLWADRYRLAGFEPRAMERMIIEAARLHMEHIRTAGDPFESGSARPLDFGHWIAHKMEEVTVGQLRHGEAVAIGIALDATYSFRCGLITSRELQLLLDLLAAVGFRLHHPALDGIDLHAALREFREHLGGPLSLPLLNGIGSSIEADGINMNIYRECAISLAARTGAGGPSDAPGTSPVGARHTGYVFH